MDKRKTEGDKKEEAKQEAQAQWLEAQLIKEHKKKTNERNKDSKDS